jgi:uncharacterized membrane protein (DUF485 family)
MIGAATDISPLTHRGPKPDHERTAADEAGTVNWEAIAMSASFKQLLRAKRRFIIPAMFTFVIYYFALPVLVGYARPLMEKRVLGPVNLAYLFALSQFFMAWIIAVVYVRAANKFDRQARDVIQEERRS